MNSKQIGSKVKATGFDLIGVLVKKGFISGNFMYTIQTEDGSQYNVYQVESL